MRLAADLHNPRGKGASGTATLADIWTDRSCSTTRTAGSADGPPTGSGHGTAAASCGSNPYRAPGLPACSAPCPSSGERPRGTWSNPTDACGQAGRPCRASCARCPQVRRSRCSPRRKIRPFRCGRIRLPLAHPLTGLRRRRRVARWLDTLACTHQRRCRSRTGRTRGQRPHRDAHARELRSHVRLPRRSSHRRGDRFHRR